MHWTCSVLQGSFPEEDRDDLLGGTDARGQPKATGVRQGFLEEARAGLGFELEKKGGALWVEA